jgi:hypothetical protein
MRLCWKEIAVHPLGKLLLLHELPWRELPFPYWGQTVLLLIDDVGVDFWVNIRSLE